MPKRVGQLMPLIASKANLQEAFLRSLHESEAKQSVIRFRNNLNDNLYRISRQLLDGTYSFGHYQFFEIVDQKRRLICAASFEENVVFQAMMRICHPVFDNYQIATSFASRPGLGQYKALEKAQQYAQQYRYFAKLDVKKFFYSIDHMVLLQLLCRLFKDPVLLHHFQAIIESYEASPGKGVPIGNLTSQYFANHYLAVADHYALEVLHVKAIVRYMDDILLFDNDKRALMRKVHLLEQFINSKLRLELHEPVVNQTRFGIPFLGYVVYPHTMRLSSRSLLRYRKKMIMLAQLLREGRITEKEYAQRAQCLHTFIAKADTKGYVTSLVSRYEGIYPERGFA